MIAPADPAEVLFPSDRPSRVFALTPAGGERFYRLMMDTTSNQGTYQRFFRIKALHLEYIPPADQLSLVDHYISYCQMGLRYQQAEAQDFATNPVKQRSVSNFYNAVALDLMDLVSQQWQLELAWAQRLRKQVVARRREDQDATKRKGSNEYVHSSNPSQLAQVCQSPDCCLQPHVDPETLAAEAPRCPVFRLDSLPQQDQSSSMASPKLKKR
ncbi:MAG TPA: hypothetical protein VKV40_10795 [Ktedonobacteraceae bacterium]|nr:hypothetical protein [Ktedonobacteraceae bacterium]